MTEDDQDLLDELTECTKQFQLGSQRLSEHESLTLLAYDAAKRGDFADARLRLERRDNPKFYSEQDCEAQYAAAMTEKRKRGVAA